jgi:hypothetical protein
LVRTAGRGQGAGLSIWDRIYRTEWLEHDRKDEGFEDERVGDKSTGRVSQDRKERTGHAENDSKGSKLLQEKCGRTTVMGQPR